MIDLLLIATGILVVVVTVGFIIVRGRRRRNALDGLDFDRPAVPPKTQPPAVVEESPAPEASAQSVVEAPAPTAPQEPSIVTPAEPVEKPAEPVGPPRRKLATRLSEGLTKSRRALSERLASVVRRDRLDDEAWEEIEEALITADVGVRVTTRVVERLREMKPSPAELPVLLRRELVEVLSRKDGELQTVEGIPNVWLVTGVNGVGKTTSIAKLAYRLRGQGKQVVLAAADTFRAAAIDQLGVWAERLGIHMIKHAEGADPGAVVFDAIQHAKARAIDVVIIDTAGRLHTKSNLMEELRKVKRIADREAGSVAEVLLVLDATVGQNGIAQAKTFQEAIDVTGVILTKLDGTAKGGIVVAVQEELGIPVKAVGVGETMEDLQPFDPESFVDALIES